MSGPRDLDQCRAEVLTFARRLGVLLVAQREGRVDSGTFATVNVARGNLDDACMSFARCLTPPAPPSDDPKIGTRCQFCGVEWPMHASDCTSPAREIKP